KDIAPHRNVMQLISWRGHIRCGIGREIDPPIAAVSPQAVAQLCVGDITVKNPSRLSGLYFHLSHLFGLLIGYELENRSVDSPALYRSLRGFGIWLHAHEDVDQIARLFSA